jgi:hypothetical protein
VTQAAHSKYSASASERWLACPGSVTLSAGKSSKASIHAARGTAAHTVLEECLLVPQHKPEDFIGRAFDIDGFTVEFDDELASNVQWALGHLAEITAGCDIVQAETRVNYAHWIGVPQEEGFGTADVIAVRSADRELLVADYKNGRKAVDAVDNTQMMLYAGGALSQFDDVVDIDTVRMVILQPDAGRPKEHVISVADLRTWLTGRARSGANSVQMAERTYPDASQGATDWHDTFLRTGEHCTFCKAKATCPKIRGEVLETVFVTNPATPEEFESFDMKFDAKAVEQKWLSVYLQKADLIEDWLKSVRAEAERRLLAGEPVPGFKIVQGKRGARAWANADEVEAMLKTFRLKQEEMYDFKLISPTTAEKLAKAETIGKRQWPKLQALITQSEGKPHVAPESDPRPAIEVRPIDELFDVQADTTDLV